MESTLYLREEFFTEKERPLFQSGAFDASAFRYSTGVAAVRIKNNKGAFVWLPFKGQQIWRANFYGRELTMRSMFDEPASGDDFGGTYGCFLLHCGMTSMGNPGPNDNHPQHGELPNIRYDSAFITAGEDERGRFIEAGGELDYRRAFATHYTAAPKIRLYENGSVFDITMDVVNKRSSPMDYLYLCHVNFRPSEGARLIYDAKCQKVHKIIPKGLAPDKAQALGDYMDALSSDPSLQDIIDSKTQAYEPEIVFTCDFKADENGWIKCVQALPGGGADIIECRKAQLPVGIRWIARTDHEDAMGMLLPSTAEHLGYDYCQKNGQIKTLAPNAGVTFNVRAGCLDKGEAFI
jgi:hypothetical protein